MQSQSATHKPRIAGNVVLVYYIYTQNDVNKELSSGKKEHGWSSVELICDSNASSCEEYIGHVCLLCKSTESHQVHERALHKKQSTWTNRTTTAKLKIQVIYLAYSTLMFLESSLYAA